MATPSPAHDELQRIEQQIEQLQGAAANNQDALKQLEGLQQRVEALRRQISGKLTPWERTEMARHPLRPYPLDYIERIYKKFRDRIKVRKDEGIKVTKEYLEKSNTFIYLDPPYFKKGAMLYHRHYNESDHKRLADLLNGNCDKHWLLTYDERSQIRELYHNRYRQRLPLKYRVRGSRRAYELMIFSDSIFN